MPAPEAANSSPQSPPRHDGIVDIVTEAKSRKSSQGGESRSLKHRFSSHQGIAQPRMEPEPDPYVRDLHIPASVIVGCRDFVCGTLGGFAGKTVEYPLDTLKVRMQGSSAGSTLASTFRQTWAEGGVRALYKGFPLPLAGSMLETSCLFTSMGQAKKFIRSQTGKDLTLPQYVFGVHSATLHATPPTPLTAVLSHWAPPGSARLEAFLDSAFPLFSPQSS